jgi:drug/metabolite transporter (DMT)-like permease
VISARTSFLANIGIAVVAFGTMPFLKKFAIENGTGALMVAQVSGAVAAITSFALACLVGGSLRAQVFKPRSLFDLAVIGVLTAGVVVLLNALALEQTTATNRSLFQALYPFATAVFAWGMLGERLRPLHYLLMAVAAAGLFLMNRGSAGLELGRGFWMLTATLPLIGFSDAYAKRRMLHLGPSALTAGRFFFGALFLLATVPFSLGDDWNVLGRTWTWLVLAGLATVAGVTGLYRAMQRNTATLAVMFASLSPLVTAALEWTILDTSFFAWQWAGILLVIGAAIVLARVS